MCRCLGNQAADGELHRQCTDGTAYVKAAIWNRMEVRGSYQHKFELLELSRRLGGYSIVIDETVPENEIHIIETVNDSLPAKQVLHIVTFAKCA